MDDDTIRQTIAQLLWVGVVLLRDCKDNNYAYTAERADVLVHRFNCKFPDAVQRQGKKAQEESSVLGEVDAGTKALSAVRLKHGEARFDKAVRLAVWTTHSIWHWLKMSDNELDEAIGQLCKGEETNG